MIVFSAACAIMGELANAIAPMTGNAFLAASLKNSLRDWSSSFCFFSFMILKIFVSPTLLTDFRVTPLMLMNNQQIDYLLGHFIFVQRRRDRTTMRTCFSSNCTKFTLCRNKILSKYRLLCSCKIPAFCICIVVVCFHHD